MLVVSHIIMSAIFHIQLCAAFLYVVLVVCNYALLVDHLPDGIQHFVHIPLIGFLLLLSALQQSVVLPTLAAFMLHSSYLQQSSPTTSHSRLNFMLLSFCFNVVLVLPLF